MSYSPAPLPYSPPMLQSLNKAQALANQHGHSYLTGEHLLWGMVDEPTVAALLSAYHVEPIKLKADLVDELERNVPKESVRRPLELTPIVQEALARAQTFADSSRCAHVDGIRVLLGLLQTTDSSAVFLLSQVKITSVVVKQWLANGSQRIAAGSEQGPAVANGEPSPLEAYAVNLNQRAREGKIDALVGRQFEVERTVQVLCRRRKNNPLLVGEAGVGKTAIAEGLAQRIVEGQVPPVLAKTLIYSVDMGALVAGTKYRGDFEKRVNALLKQIKDDPNIVLFIDEIHTVIGAGAASGSMDAGNLLKPALSSGALRLIGSTTFREYREVFEKDQALSRRFQKIDVNEPSANETVAILEGLKSRYESHHQVVYTPEAIQAAVTLSMRYLPSRQLPDKAIDLIDEAGAHQRIVPAQDRREIIGSAQIEAVIARIAQVPVEQVSATDRQALGELESHLKSFIFGQNPAIETVVNAIKLSRAGLRDGEKPIGSFLFTGPTGVGKTEVSRQLAEQMGIKMVRFDMSEYMESHTVARLIGSPPGYTGHEKGGLLTEAVNKHPHCVLLLDEIEKAHPDIYNILLQVMDRGTLTDSHGRSVDFRNVVLILTTNVGASHAARASIGFTKQDHTTDAMEVLKRSFSPEFRNRLDRIVSFAPLGREEILRVVDKNLAALNLLLITKAVSLDIGPGVRDWLADKGFDPQMGARPMARLIEERIKQPLAELLLFGALAQGGQARVAIVDNALTVDATATATACEQANVEACEAAEA